MSAKRFRRRKYKDGQLLVYYGRLDGDSPDVIFQRGAGVPKSDAHLMYSIFGAKRQSHDFATGQAVYSDSLTEELISRGYDISTLEFKIRKVKP